MQLFAFVVFYKSTQKLGSRRHTFFILHSLCWVVTPRQLSNQVSEKFSESGFLISVSEMFF